MGYCFLKIKVEKKKAEGLPQAPCMISGRSYGNTENSGIELTGIKGQPRERSWWLC
jgi:hypothetical protein